MCKKVGIDHFESKNILNRYLYHKLTEGRVIAFQLRIPSLEPDVLVTHGFVCTILLKEWKHNSNLQPRKFRGDWAEGRI